MSLGEEDDVDDERMMHVLRNGVDEVERTMPRRREGGGGGGQGQHEPAAVLRQHQGSNNFCVSFAKFWCAEINFAVILCEILGF